MGGYQLGTTGIWVGDYTIEAENGGMGVFPRVRPRPRPARPLRHELRLGEQHRLLVADELRSWGSFAEDPYIGTSPMHMDAYAKQYLGWLDLKTLNAGDKATFDLGPAEHDTAGDHQAAAIHLPSYQRTESPFPTDGADQDDLYSGKGDNLRVDDDEPERPELRQRHHRQLERLADGHGHLPGGHDGLPAALLDRRRGRRRGHRGRRREVRRPTTR